MLRPRGSFLGSSRAARRAAFRAERRKAFSRAGRGAWDMVWDLWGAALDLVLLFAVPLLYLASAYLALDLPLRWASNRGAYGYAGLFMFLASIVIALVGIARVLQQADPIVPVRPKFARAMFGVAWVAGLLLTIGDLLS